MFNLSLLVLVNFIFLSLTILSLVVVLADRFYLKSYKKRPDDRPWFVLICSEILPLMLVIMVVRTYLYEPYRIPSESMYPNLKTGDVIVVNKTSYDVKFPFTNLSIWPLRDPKRGEMAVFKFPIDNNTIFIKRVIGVPGDELEWRGDDLFVNGEQVSRMSAQFDGLPGRYNFENLDDRKYLILRNASIDSSKFALNSTYLLMRYQRENGLFADNNDGLKIKIPEGYFFVMGDNRDGSQDSRMWGLVSRSEMIGQATNKLLHIDPKRSWRNIGQKFQFKNWEPL